MSIYRIISAERASFPVSLQCEVLGVSRSGYYGWANGVPSDRALSDAWLTEKIREIHRRARGVYGVRRVHAELRLGHDVRVGRKRVERLMRQAGISGLVTRRRGRTTIRVPGVRVADDLVKREFTPLAANVLWVADITYLPSWDGWLYLAAVQDTFSRRIVGWSMAEHMRAELVVDALKMAINRRRPEPGLVHHSDQGSQYVSLAFGQQARDAGIAVSMGSKGDCFDKRRRRELLLHAKEGARAPPNLENTTRARCRRVRVHRGLLQPRATPLHTRLPLPRAIREPNHQNQDNNQPDHA